MYLPYYVHLIRTEVTDCKNAKSGKHQNKNAGLC